MNKYEKENIKFEAINKIKNQNEEINGKDETFYFIYLYKFIY